MSPVEPNSDAPAAGSLELDYYSDLLCVWAWIAQRRLEELTAEFGAAVQIRHHYIDVFGDVAAKMRRQWQARGGFEGFGKHVQEAVAGYDYATVNPAVWDSVRPVSSASAHHVLKAVELSHSAAAACDLALHMRRGFFSDARDIGDISVLEALAEEAGLDIAAIRLSLRNGSAMAALMSDYQAARELGLRGSPSYVLDGGRQILYGNVGYRVLQANIDELLRRPAGEASWC